MLDAEILCTNWRYICPRKLHKKTQLEYWCTFYSPSCNIIEIAPILQEELESVIRMQLARKSDTADWIPGQWQPLISCYQLATWIHRPY